MSKFSAKNLYEDKEKGKIVFVTDYRFGDNHYIIFDKDGNVFDKVPPCLFPKNTNFSMILDLYCNGGSLYL